ncbi:MAG TPA: MFS transporter [Myxococcota bacterium]|nr:MFS transporter [Myxococcota bacterium]
MSRTAPGASWLRWPDDLRGRALWVVVGCLVCQMGLGYGYVFGPLAKPLLDEFGWSRAEYSGMRLPQLALMAAVSPFVGVASVRFGARPILIASTGLLGLAFAAVARIDALWQLYLLVMLQGVLAQGLGDISVGQVVSRWTRQSRGLALGIVYTGSNLGGSLFSRVAAWLDASDSWRTAFAALGLGGAALMLPCALWLVRDRPAQLRVVARGTPPAALEGTPPAAPGGTPPAALEGEADDLDLRAALRTRSFWVLGFSLFAFFFYFVGLLEHLVLFLTDGGMPLVEAAGHLSNAIALGIASKIGFGLLADRMPPRAAMLLDYGLLALSSLLLLALPDARLLWPFVAVWGIATAARDVVTPLMIVECFGLRHLAPIYGAVMLALLPGGGLGPLFAATLHDRTGSYAGAFAVFAVLNAMSFASLFLLRRERRGARAAA